MKKSKGECSFGATFHYLKENDEFQFGVKRIGLFDEEIILTEFRLNCLNQGYGTIERIIRHANLKDKLEFNEKLAEGLILLDRQWM